MSDAGYGKKDQLQAAYALNMCTVSVSQIVDYNDEYILEQEYEAILNNLNLEMMPKDEALLTILVKLLNVINFFRIDRIKKEQIEKQYQRKMKSAIWSAVPNISLIVSGNPAAIASSLITQVGIGYMNYRRAKAQALADKEDSELELRITAMEQFHALRRELFTTAWRLADEYKFPDRYRLTERQIAQYNQILMDTNELRKYERLWAIRDKFEAYFPFWYYLGHTAKYISEDMSNGLKLEERDFYRKQAMEHFGHFEEVNHYNILREDELTASFALEYVDLLLLEEKPAYSSGTKRRASALIQSAVEKAGNAMDILEMCAVSYLKIGETKRAEELLRNLVNEEYNTAVNARLLSRIYVSEFLLGDDAEAKKLHRILAARVPDVDLFPMPSNREKNVVFQDKQLLEVDFLSQKEELKAAYQNAIEQFIEKYTILFNRVIPVPALDLPDSYFEDTGEAIEKRLADVRKALQKDKDNQYKSRICDCDFRRRYVDLINEMLEALDGLQLYRNSLRTQLVDEYITKKLKAVSGELNRIQYNLNKDKTFTDKDYLLTQDNNSFQKITNEFFTNLFDLFMDGIERAGSLKELESLKAELEDFCKKQGITRKTYDAAVRENLGEEKGYHIDSSIWDEAEQDEKVNSEMIQKMLLSVKGADASILTDDSKMEMIILNRELSEYSDIVL